MIQTDKNWVEWSVFAVSGVLVIGTLGYLTYDALTATQEPPAIEVQLGQAEHRSGHFAVPVTVRNRGSRTAEAVHIQVELTKKDGGKERANFEIHFVPRQSSHRGYVTFETDPRTAKQMTARPLGYHIP